MTNYLTQTLVALVGLVSVTLHAHDQHEGASAANSKRSLLPLGDGKALATPKQGYVFACSTRFPGGGGAHRAGDWIKDGHWDPSAKPIVEGRVEWPDAAIAISVEGDQRIVRANNLPKHPTGEFPIRRGSKAYDYDRNPNYVQTQPILLRLPASPAVATNAGCVPLGMVGFALSGVAIFNAFDLQGRDAPAYEVQDKCNGHPERGGQYHYHDWSECIGDKAGAVGKHSDHVGFMLDGFPIFGLKGERGKEVTNADLDECHGHTHEVEIDGKKVTTYHYHFTREYPYTIGCFRGSVDSAYMPRPGLPSHDSDKRRER
jgi:YHYH protein